MEVGGQRCNKNNQWCDVGRWGMCDMAKNMCFVHSKPVFTEGWVCDVRKMVAQGRGCKAAVVADLGAWISEI